MPTLGRSGSPTGVDGDDDAVRVFMSYRRTDDANFTGRFHDKLIGVFGDDNVFRDIDSIPAGTRFEDVINARLSDVDAVVALIGPTWAGRIDSPSDFVRMEIANALQYGTPVIPVLIEDTALPPADELPDDLKPMLDRQTVRVRRDPDFHRDAARVVDGVRQAVKVQREREAAARRQAEEAARAQREEEEQRQADIARRKELEEELARATARANEERRAAEALAAERAQRLAELTRLEEEATQRRIADERARVAEIVESQAARERDAVAAAARAEELRRELGLPEPVAAADTAADTAPTQAFADEDEVVHDVTPAPVPEVAQPERREVETSVPASRPPEAIAPTREAVPAAPASVVFTGRRSVASASRAEVGGGVLLLVATAWAIQALFDSKDGGNAFKEVWSTDITGVLLTAALLLPLLAFRHGGPVHAVCAGASVGYIAYQGLADATWFSGYYGGVYFPNNIIFIAVLLAGAWYLFRRGSPAPPARIDHSPSRYLQIVAAAATFGAGFFYAQRFYDSSHGHRIVFVFFAAGVLMLFLSVRKSLEATVALATLAAESSIFYLAIALGYDDDRAMNVAIASAVLTGAALWRTRRATPVATA